MAKSYIRALRKYGNIPRDNAYYKLCKRGRFGHISKWYYEKVTIDSKLIAVNTRDTYLIDFVNWCNQKNIVPKIVYSLFSCYYSFDKSIIDDYRNEGYTFHNHWCFLVNNNEYRFSKSNIEIIVTEYKTAELKQKAIYPNEFVYGNNSNRICGYGKVSNHKRLLAIKQKEHEYIKQKM